MNQSTTTSAAPDTPAVPQGLLRNLQEGRGQRSLQLERAAINEEARTVTLAFASEAPVDRWWGREILECSASAMRQGRLATGANLLCDHDTRDVVGVIESVELGADRIVRAVVRFGKSARAEEVWQDVRDGIRRNVSVGYIVHRAVLAEERDGLETYRITDWEPYEISLVSVPADASVGVGRSLPAPVAAAPVTPSSTEEKRTMDQTTAAAPVAAPVAATPTVAAVPNQAAQRNHAVEIAAIGKTFKGGDALALDAIQRGLTVEAFQAEAVRHLSAQPKPTADIGMTDKEVRQFSIVRALHALANPMDQNARSAAAFEFEASAAAAKKLGRDARGIMLPYDVARASDMVKGTAAKGGNLVATELLSGSFIDILRNAMVLTGMGVPTLSGLVGDIAIPKQTGAATAYWVAEDAAPTQSGQTVGQVAMTPKTLGAFTDISRKLLLQSSIDVESMVQKDLAMVLALAIQQAAINGTGANNQPKGVMTWVNPSVVGGANGAAPTWDHIVGLETAVSVANADIGTLSYLTNAKVRGKLKTTSKVAGQNGFIWENGSTPLNGYGCAVTNAMPSNLTKGTGTNLSSAIFGNWADMVIGMWGSLDLTVDTVTLGTTGAVRVIALQDVDIALRNTESFATFADIITG